jgi:hypothetical protein
LQELLIVKLFCEFIQGRRFGNYIINYVCHTRQYSRLRGGSQWAY